MDLAKVFEDLTDVMKRNGISMPSSLTMLARGLATIEGVVADLSPEINVMNVVTARMGSQLLHSIDWRGEIVRDAQAVYASAHKSLEIPSLMADILRTGLKGEANLGVEHHVGDDMARLMQDIVLKRCCATSPRWRAASRGSPSSASSSAPPCSGGRSCGRIKKNNAPGRFPRGIQTPMPFCPAWASL